LWFASGEIPTEEPSGAEVPAVYFVTDILNPPKDVCLNKKGLESFPSRPKVNTSKALST
jgi:hypothetical protein